MLIACLSLIALYSHTGEGHAIFFSHKISHLIAHEFLISSLVVFLMIGKKAIKPVYTWVIILGRGVKFGCVVKT